MMSHRLSFVVVMAVLSTAVAAAQTTASCSLRSDVEIAMPDSVVLAADIYLPASAEHVPTVLLRTPYDKRAFAWLAQPLAVNGYAVVVQDVRGQGASKGEFEPFLHERADGLATLDWIARQPWTDGHVALWGTSYLAYAGLLLVASEHPAVVTMVSMSGWGDAREMLFPGGALQLMVSAGWNLAPQIRGENAATFDWPSLFRMLPVDTIGPSFGVKPATWGAVSRIVADPVLQRETSIRERRLAIPILHVSGWNDFLVNEEITTFEQAEKDGTSGHPAFQKLVVGPWMHDQIWSEDTRVADEDFGPAARMGGRKVVELTIRWLNFWMKGQETGISHEPRVSYFLMGANEWVGADAWPPANAQPQTWFLGSGGGANSSNGDGSLARVKPARASADRFTFDPRDPVPTMGGANFHHFPEMLGPRDQRPVEERRDVLVYTSAPLSEDTRVVGPIEVELYVSSRAPSTDFTAKLVEVRADGYARIIADGIRRLHQVPTDGFEPIIIDLGNTAIWVAKGNRLRLDVSSSNFPKYSRNPNTGENPEAAREMRPAEQQVKHGGQTASQLRLYVTPQR